MNVPFSPKSDLDAFHCERSKCIDAFSQIEAAVIGLLNQAGQTCGAEPFNQKLTQLKKAKPSPKLSKARLAQAHGLLDRCEALAELRNDIVHSTLQLAEIDESSRACFINMRYCQSGSQTARLFTLKGLRELSIEMARLAEDLRGPCSSQTC